MRTTLFTSILLILAVTCFAQKTESSDKFTISGLIEKPVTISYAEVAKHKAVDIGDFKITNHLGEFKREYKNVKGVLLTNLLKDVLIEVESPKQLSECYFVFKATDGYTVVFSWNELFNTATGNSVYLVTEADGKGQQTAPEKILLISTQDFKTGRRHIKGLQSIEVKRV